MTIYNYKQFIDNELTKYTRKKYTDHLELFHIKYSNQSNRTIINTVFGERYMNNLVQKILPEINKYICNHGFSSWHRYPHDVWHTYIIANWSMKQIEKIEKTKSGRFAWSADWEDQRALYHNENAYDGTGDLGLYNKPLEHIEQIDVSREHLLKNIFS